ncbi:MAG: DegT/DnrJ/EryC1/StrS family aminotransferase [Bacteroidota bacterium]
MKKRIVMNDFAKEYTLSGRALRKIVDKVFSSGKYILGPNVSAFENEFAHYLGSKYCIGVGNGLEAIQIALMGLGIGDGDEVITVSNSDVATALAILYVGATPVFVDVDEYFHMDPDMLERAVTKRTKAILPVHLFGQVVDMDAVVHIAKKHKVFLIEDACQAHGAMYKGKKAGTFGVAGCFSFYPTKNLGAFGDAGAIVTDSVVLYNKYLMLRNRGASRRCVHPLKGLNSRLDEIQAAILRYKLLRLDTMNARRRHIAARYKSQLCEVSEVLMPIERGNAQHAYHQFVIRVPRREKLMKYLSVHGVDSLVHYPTPIHMQQSFLKFRHIRLPNTEKYTNEILSLPVHPFMTDTHVDDVSRLIKKFYQRKN